MPGRHSTVADPPQYARATGARLTHDMLFVQLEDGREIGAPLVWFPWLLHATPEQRACFEVSGRGGGIHWPLLDEDISVAGLLGVPD